MSACAPRTLYRPLSRGSLEATLLVPLVLSLAVACAPSQGSPLSDPERATAAALPAWYLAPPDDTASALHGVGAASALPVAKSAALVDVASKLTISVRSTFSDRTTLHHDRLDQYIESEIVAHVSDREFRAYEVLETALSGGVFYALVRVDRPQLILDTLEGLRESNRELASRLDPARARTPFGYHLAFREAQPSLESAESSIAVLATLSPEFDPAPYLRQYQLYRERNDRALADIAVALVPDSESERVAGIVQELLARSGMQSAVFRGVVDVGAVCRDLCIEIASEWSGRYAVRRHIATLTTTFRARAADGVVASAHQHRVQGSALAGEEQARGAAVARLREALVRDGILRSVGFTQDAAAGLAQRPVPN